MWTGNDTIVDGYSCVTLWDQEEGESPACIGCLREDENGWVWRYETATRFISNDGKFETEWLEKFGVVNNWIFLYDFSRSDWKSGMRIEKMHYAGYAEDRVNDHWEAPIYHVSKMTLLNGEEVLIADDIIYGIGNFYYHSPALFEGAFVERSKLWNAKVLEYWCDGELLLQNDSPDAIKRPTMDHVPSAISYDLQGRPVDGAQRGILIRNGKKILVK